MNAEIMHLDLPEHRADKGASGTLSPSLSLLGDIAVTLEVRLGTKELSVRELLDLRIGAVLNLDKHLQQDIEVVLNGRTIARGQIVAVDDRFGVRISEILETP
jgi:flagellar motor switch protein FliN/FliY